MAEDFLLFINFLERAYRIRRGSLDHTPVRACNLFSGCGGSCESATTFPPPSFRKFRMEVSVPRDSSGCGPATRADFLGFVSSPLSLRNFSRRAFFLGSLPNAVFFLSVDVLLVGN